MPHLITQNCCNDAECVPVCPVNCIHPTPDEPDYATAEMLYIDPDGCIDCGACIPACPVDAIVADYEMDDAALPFLELNAAYYKDPARQSYPATPPARAPRGPEEPGDGPLRVAIVGSGPAGCYVAEELLGKRAIDIRIDMFERQVTPFGLLRFGVAPDHQKTKAIGDRFARSLNRDKVRLFLNVEVGETITHSDLEQRYDAVIYTTGAMHGQDLSIPGEDLPGSHSATEFVAWYNGHPDFADLSFDLSGERAVVIGNGNVAIDVARVLLTDPDHLRRTDIANHALNALENSRIREVMIVGRRGFAQAGFTTPELIGLGNAPGISVEVQGDSRYELAAAATAARVDSMDHYKSELLAGLGSAEDDSPRKAILRFCASPVSISGSASVEGIRLVRNTLTVDDNGRVHARPTSETEDIDCGLVLRSVGFRGTTVPGVPFDSARGVLPNLDGRVVDPVSREPLAGVYTSGWVKRGPSGSIGTNKHCARETVSAVIEDWSAHLLGAERGDSDIADLLAEHVDVSGWKAIDEHERARGRQESRPRIKIVDVEELLQVARAAGAA